MLSDLVCQDGPPKPRPSLRKRKQAGGPFHGSPEVCRGGKRQCVRSTDFIVTEVELIATFICGFFCKKSAAGHLPAAATPVYNSRAKFFAHRSLFEEIANARYYARPSEDRRGGRPCQGP